MATDETKPGQDTPDEITSLQGAVEKIRERIAWHEEQIVTHRDARNALLAALRTQLGSLENVDGGKEKPSPQVEEDSGETARQTILSFIKGKGGRATNTEIKEEWGKRNRQGNPSVELSRMVKAKVLKRPTRGVYEIVK
jgi:hypothetical protein